MSRPSTALAQRLSDVLGLDEETISSQIVPHVSALNQREQVVDYLTTLIGSEQADFIAHYADSRFGKPGNKAWDGASSSTAHRPSQKERRSAAAAKTPNSPQQPRQQQQQQQSRQAAGPKDQLKGKPEEIQLSTAASTDIEDLEGQLSLLDINLKPRMGTRCFCAGTLHSLSALAPMCPSCALVHCSINSPLRCTACRQPLMTNAAREDLVASLQARRRTVIEAEVERLRTEQARRDGVAFPQLSGSGSFLSSSNVPSHMRTTPHGLHPATWANRTSSSLPAAEELARKIEEAYTFDPSARSSATSQDTKAHARTITIGANGKVTKVTGRRPAPRSYQNTAPSASTSLDNDEDVDLLMLARSPDYAGWIDQHDDYVISSSSSTPPPASHDRARTLYVAPVPL